MIANIVVYDGSDDLDVFGPLEVLRSAADYGANITTSVVTREPQQTVMTAHGVRFEPDGVLGNGSCDLLMVTGGSWGTRSEVGAWGEYQRGQLLDSLVTASAGAATTAGICTGTMLLAHAGLVGDRRASTHHTAWDDLTATGAQLVKDRVVDDGDLVTSGGVTSGIDLALWLVQREFSLELADRVARRMEYPRFIPTSNAKP